MRYSAVALAGEPGAGKSTVIRLLQPQLGWPIFAAGNYIRQKWEKERKHNPAIPDFPDYFRDSFTDENIIDLNRVLAAHIESGNYIIDSRFASLNCRGHLHALSVYLHADIDIRVERGLNSSEHQGMSRDQIKQRLMRRKEDERTRGRSIYGDTFDCHDPAAYVLAIDTGNKSPKEISDLILEEIRGKLVTARSA